MTRPRYDRLSALDASFLELEDANCHMHIGSVGLYEAAALCRPDGGLDFERISSLLDAQMYRSDRFRQKLARIPRLDHPVWIDDETFNIHYHVRHTALPTPGDLRLLKRLAGRIMSQQLDRGKPLWELWFVEGVEGGRFAVISKVHHCLADGIGGTDLVTSVMTTSPDEIPEAGPAWSPQPAPTETRLLVDEIGRRATLPLDVARAGLRALGGPGAALDTLRETAADLGQAASSAFGTASQTPFNQPIGPHRRFDWLAMDFERVKALRKKMDAKVNDVVLSVVAGAVRDFLKRHRVPLAGLDFRVMVPVSVRRDEERGAAGNRISSLVVPLPLLERDPLARLRRVVETTRGLKASGQSRGLEALFGVMELSDALAQWLARAARDSQAVNFVVTNVPGPPVPIYLCGARLLEAFPLVPLAARQALGIALFSYAGGLYWGFNADWDRLPELHDFVLSIDAHFRELAEAVDALG